MKGQINPRSGGLALERRKRFGSHVLFGGEKGNEVVVGGRQSGRGGR